LHVRIDDIRLGTMERMQQILTPNDELKKELNFKQHDIFLYNPLSVKPLSESRFFVYVNSNFQRDFWQLNEPKHKV